MSESDVFWLAFLAVAFIVLSTIAPQFWRWLERMGYRKQDALRFDDWAAGFRTYINTARDAIDRGDRDAAHAALDQLAGIKR